MYLQNAQNVTDGCERANTTSLTRECDMDYRSKLSESSNYGNEQNT